MQSSSNSGSCRPAQTAATIDLINRLVSDKVGSAIAGDLSFGEIVRIALGFLDPDDILAAISKASSTHRLEPADAAVRTGSGRPPALLSRRHSEWNRRRQHSVDHRQGRLAEHEVPVLRRQTASSTPSTRRPAPLLSRHDQNGTGDVNTPSIIGMGGWQNMKFCSQRQRHHLRRQPGRPAPLLSRHDPRTEPATSTLHPSSAWAAGRA